MRICNFKFCLIVFQFCCFTAFAEVPAYASPELGYYELNSPEVPEAVKNSKSSVFRIVELASPEFTAKISLEERDVLFKENCSQPQHFLHYLQCKALAGPPNFGKLWYIPYLSTGTAFFVENSSTLWTVWHNLYNQSKPIVLFLSPAIIKWPMLKRQEYMRQLVPEFLLFDISGQLVFDSRTSKTKPKFLSNGDPAARQIYGGDIILNTAVDFARIQMPAEFQRTPLPLAPATAEKKRDFYVLGFPGTSESASPGRTTSNGYDAYISHGKETLLETLFSRLQLPASELSVVVHHLLASTLMALNMDVQTGFSGGPLLNSKGEVVGILADRVESPEKKSLGAIGLKASWIKAFSLDPEAAIPKMPNTY